MVLLDNLLGEEVVAELKVERRDDGIVVLTISNPARRNALTFAMWQQLGALCEELSHDPASRAVILTGAEGHFSAGADISEFDELRSGAAAVTYDETTNACQASLRNLSKPTIAAISGFCVGGGCGIATECDFRIADKTAKFGIPAARLGILYGLEECQGLFSLVGLAQAKRILFSGERIDATEAARIGLVDRLCEGDCLEAAITMAKTMIGNAPLSIAGSKKVLNALATGAREKMAGEIEALAEAAFASEDYAEGRRAFMEKRAPVFKGR